MKPGDMFWLVEHSVSLFLVSVIGEKGIFYTFFKEGEAYVVTTLAEAADTLAKEGAVTIPTKEKLFRYISMLIDNPQEELRTSEFLSLVEKVTAGTPIEFPDYVRNELGAK